MVSGESLFLIIGSRGTEILGLIVASLSPPSFLRTANSITTETILELANLSQALLYCQQMKKSSAQTDKITGTRERASGRFLSLLAMVDRDQIEVELSFVPPARRDMAGSGGSLSS